MAKQKYEQKLFLQSSPVLKILSLVVLKNAIDTLRVIITRLQKRHMDIRQAYISLNDAKSDLAALQNGETSTKPIWKFTVTNPIVLYFWLLSRGFSSVPGPKPVSCVF